MHYIYATYYISLSTAKGVRYIGRKPIDPIAAVLLKEQLYIYKHCLYRCI